jgi:hypothetical protein
LESLSVEMAGLIYLRICMHTTINTDTLTPHLANADDLSPDTRIWVYMSNRPLSETEVEAVQTACTQFVRQWTAHNQALRARAEVFDNNMILLAVDESQAGASGCSIDKSVHFLEALGQQIGADFFERMRFGWQDAGKVRYAVREEFANQVRQGQISADMLVLNTLVQTRAELQSRWWLPYKESWHQRLV